VELYGTSVSGQYRLCLFIDESVRGIKTFIQSVLKPIKLVVLEVNAEKYVFMFRFRADLLKLCPVPDISERQ
jgi:hypothetical protein